MHASSSQNFSLPEFILVYQNKSGTISRYPKRKMAGGSSSLGDVFSCCCVLCGSRAVSLQKHGKESFFINLKYCALLVLPHVSVEELVFMLCDSLLLCYLSLAFLPATNHINFQRVVESCTLICTFVSSENDRRKDSISS